MRVGLYGLPTAGKTYILDAVRNLETLAGSAMLREIASNFAELSELEKNAVRKQLVLNLRNKDDFIMDGHYSFGDEEVFTEEDGELYDTFLYLYVDPAIIKQRMADSVRNSKYLEYDIESWQMAEIDGLREYCHLHNKDFYVIDNPSKGYFADIRIVLQFIDSIVCGFSCVGFAREVVDKISAMPHLSLMDGDRTFIKEDSSAILGYKTHLFDGNFYTGFQSWRHAGELTEYLRYIDYSPSDVRVDQYHVNEEVRKRQKGEGIILTTGYYGAWQVIAEKNRMPFYYGPQMCSDTKYFITKFLQEQGSFISAFGDSMNDYYMLKQADEGYLISKPDGSLSRSLKRKDLEGITIV